MTNVFHLARLPVQPLAVTTLHTNFADGDEACATEIRMRVSAALAEREASRLERAESFFHAQQELGVVMAGLLCAELGTDWRAARMGPVEEQCPQAALNLSVHVSDPFTPSAAFDYGSFKEAIVLAIRMLDNAVDLGHGDAKGARRIGLGVLGLGSMFTMLGIRYGQPQAVAMASQLAEVLRDTAYAASIALAQERGAFPAFDAGRYFAANQAYLTTLPSELLQALHQNGLRNEKLLAIAPTRTISLAFADNATSGIEPIQSYLSPVAASGAETVSLLEDRTYRLYRWLFGAEVPLPSSFVMAHQLTAQQRSDIEEAFAPRIDGGIQPAAEATVTRPMHVLH